MMSSSNFSCTSSGCTEKIVELTEKIEQYKLIIDNIHKQYAPLKFEIIERDGVIAVKDKDLKIVTGEKNIFESHCKILANDKNVLLKKLRETEATLETHKNLVEKWQRSSQDLSKMLSQQVKNQEKYGFGYNVTEPPEDYTPAPRHNMGVQTDPEPEKVSTQSSSASVQTQQNSSSDEDMNAHTASGREENVLSAGVDPKIKAKYFADQAKIYLKKFQPVSFVKSSSTQATTSSSSPGGSSNTVPHADIIKRRLSALDKGKGVAQPKTQPKVSNSSKTNLKREMQTPKKNSEFVKTNVKRQGKPNQTFFENKRSGASSSKRHFAASSSNLLLEKLSALEKLVRQNVKCVSKVKQAQKLKAKRNMGQNEGNKKKRKAHVFANRQDAHQIFTKAKIVHHKPMISEKVQGSTDFTKRKPIVHPNFKRSRTLIGVLDRITPNVVKADKPIYNVSMSSNEFSALNTYLRGELKPIKVWVPKTN